MSEERTCERSNQRTKIVVVGAGFAGLQAARRLATRPDFDITIIERTNHHLFQPLLYQVAMAGLNPSEIASPVRAILKNYPNITSLMGEVETIDREQRCLKMDGGQTIVPYDYLVMAVGGRTSYFGKDEWSQHALGLKTLDEALTIRHRILTSFELAEKTDDHKLRRKLMTCVVIGGGPTGVEMAGGLAELTRSVIRWDFRRIRPNEARVILLEGSDRLLGAFSPKLSNYTSQKLQKMGCEVRLNTRVTDIQDGKVCLGDEVIECGTIIWAAGVGGHPLARQLGGECDRAGRVQITPYLHLPHDERVFCVGDMAALNETLKDGKTRPLPGVAQVAMQQGYAAANNIISHQLGRQLTIFKYWDKGSMATIGRSSAVASTRWLDMTGFMAWCAWLFIHLIYIVDFQNQLLVMARWTWAYLTWKWGARLITRIPQSPEPTPKKQSTEPPPDTPRVQPAGPPVESGEVA